MKIIKVLGVLFLAVVLIHSFGLTSPSANSFGHQREHMVSVQLRGRDIVDANVLRAMGAVPRHQFVPSDLRDLAYQDTPLPIGHGQTISQPYIVALMSQVLAVSKGQRILEIGTGSGYQAAVLAQMGARVFTIEIIAELGHQAEKVIGELGYDNIQVKIGDGYQGWRENAPFDAIIVTCAPSTIPEPLKQQLAEGGRMVIPVGEKGFQQLVLLTKRDDKIKKEKIVDVRFVPMVDNKGKTY